MEKNLKKQQQAATRAQFVFITKHDKQTLPYILHKW